LFSTVTYARKIVFSSLEDAHKTIDTMSQIHTAVENKRGESIPDWAYRDVLFMLIHYSIAAHELLEYKLTSEEKEEVYNVFYRLGVRMGVKELPQLYTQWLPVREAHMEQNLQRSHFTIDLFQQYKKHLGSLRFKLLVESQKLVVPHRVKELMGFSKFSLLAPLVPLYKLTRACKAEWVVKYFLLPSEYHKQISALDMYKIRP
jgi:hypothetical protein